MSKETIILVEPDNIDILRNFISIHLGDSASSFRYFQLRPLDVINNHLITILLNVKDKPVAYGHLDPEDDKTWLGVAVGEKFRGNGYGKKIMNYLIHTAKDLNIPTISLSVDSDNIIARKLYESLGFVQVKQVKNTIFYNLDTK